MGVDASPPPDAFSSVLTKDISTGTDRGYVWALDDEGQLTHGALCSFVWTWSSIRSPPGGKPLTKISATCLGPIWAVNSINEVWYRSSHSTLNWEKVKFPGLCVHIACAAYSVWAIGQEGKVYARLGVDVFNSMGTEWKEIDGRLSSISVSPTMQVMGLNKGGQIFFRSGVNRENPTGKTWEKINGAANGIAFGENTAWAWNRAGNVFYRVGITKKCPKGKSWAKCDGTVATVSAGSGVAYACDKEGRLMRRDGMATTNPQGTQWQTIESLRFSQVTCGSAHSINVENSAAQEIEAHRASLQSNHVSCNWLNGSGGILDSRGAFIGGRVLYTWQMARRVICIRHVRARGSDFNEGLSSKQSEGSPLRDRLSPKAASAIEDGSDENEYSGTYVRAAGLGPLLCDGDGASDESCQFYCEFASTEMDWRGYLDTSVIYLRSVKNGKYVHFDEHTRLAHCNKTSGGKSCKLTMRSNFDKGTVKIEFSEFSGHILTFNLMGSQTSMNRNDGSEVHDDGAEIPKTLHHPESDDNASKFAISIVNDGSEFRGKFPCEDKGPIVL